MEAPEKPTRKILTFKDAQSAITGTLEAWLPRLVESNDAMEQALLLLERLSPRPYEFRGRPGAQSGAGSARQSRQSQEIVLSIW